jgi:glycosyltransferase involved in cell wall biosynthesis
MQILRIISSMNPASGGPCQGIRNSVRELATRGIRNEVVCLDDPTASFLKEDPFPIHALGPARGPWQYASGLRTWLNEHLARFDVVIVHGLWAYHTFATYRAFSRLPAQQVPRRFVMPHGMLDPYFQKAPGRRLKALRNWIYWQLLEARTVNTAAGLLFTCATELHLARSTFRPYRPAREWNVGYGIQPPPLPEPAQQQFFQAACPSLHGAPYFLFLGRIHPKKGVDVLLSAYETQLQKFYPEGEASANGHPVPHLVIAGPGQDTDFGRMLRQRVTDAAALRHRVHFPGLLTGQAKWGAFYGCDAFILPSHQENFGIAVAEALACQRAVLISDQVNIWHEIDECGAGLVEPDTLPGTTQLLQRWLRLSPDERTTMHQRARLCFETHFTIPQATTRLLDALTATA